jgi:HPt (histidine-containing phosphotransfer) domain-containing protein
MTDGHSRHLAASLTAIEEIARQMEQAAREGRSPAGGQALTPLDSAEWTPLAAALARIQARMQEAIRLFAPDMSERRDTVEARAATFYWLSLLLLRLDEEIIDDLDPARTERKFGLLPAEERARLSQIVAELHWEVSEMRAQIERLRVQKGGRS